MSIRPACTNETPTCVWRGTRPSQPSDRRLPRPVAGVDSGDPRHQKFGGKLTGVADVVIDRIALLFAADVIAVGDVDRPAVADDVDVLGMFAAVVQAVAA